MKPYSIKALTTSEIGATKNSMHVTCPCCQTRVPVDLKASRAAMLNRVHANFAGKVANRVQRWLTNAWRLKTWHRNTRSKQGVRTDSIDAIVSTGTGKALRKVYREQQRKGNTNYFCVLWHAAPTFTEMFFACTFGNFFRVIQGLCDDSPEFAKRLQQAINLSLRRDGSRRAHGVVPDDAKGSEEVGQGLEEVFCQDTAVRL